MLTTGVVLIILGFIVGIPLLYSLGVILTIVGAALYVFGAVGRQVGPRRHYW